MRQLTRITTLTGLFALSLLLNISSATAEPILNGIAVHSELGKEQFIGALFTNKLSDEAKEILLDSGDKRIQVRVLNSRISARSFKRMWIEGMAINASPLELESQSQNMANFSNMLRVNLTTGDIFTIEKGADDVGIFLNGGKIGTINDPVFFDIMLRTWIGPVPLSSDFRQSLLVNGRVNADLQARFNATKPSDARIAAIDKLLKQKAEQKAKQEEEKQPELAAAPKITPKIKIAPPSAPAVLPPNTSIVKSAPPKATPPPIAAVKAPKVEEKKPEPVKQVALAPPAEELLDEAILEEEEDDIEFTAASVLTQTLYISKLKRWTNKHIEYPSRAISRGWEGNVRLQITIARDGSVEETTVLEEAPYKDLTRAAKKAVKKADPYPAIPKELTGKSFTFTLPVVFVLK